MPIRPNMTAGEYFAIFNRHKWVFIFAVLLIFFGASIYCALVPKKYKSSTTILVIPQRVPENYIRSTIVSRIEERMTSLRQEVTSRTRLLTVIDEMKLFADKARQGVPQEELVTEMRKRIEIQTRGNDAFTLAFAHEDPQIAMLVTSRLASFFIDENLRMREQQAVGTSEFLESQLQETKSKLEAQEEKVKQYKMKYTGELPQQTEANLHTLTRLGDQNRLNSDAIRSAEDRKAFQEVQLAQIERSLGPPTGGTTDNAGGPADGQASVYAADPAAALVAEYNTRRTQLSEASAKYTERYPEVIRLRREVDLLERRIAEARRAASPPAVAARTPAAGAIRPAVAPAVPVNPVVEEARRLKSNIATLEIEIASLKREKAEIRKNLDSFQTKVDQSPKREQELISLTRDYDNLRRSYDDLLSKKLQADLSQNLERRQKGEQFRVLDPANVPEEPFEPNRKKVYLVALFGALASGIGGVVLLAFKDTTLRTPEEFRYYFKLPLIATLPVIENHRAAKRNRLKRGFALGGLASLLATAILLLVLYGDAFHSVLRTIRRQG